MTVMTSLQLPFRQASDSAGLRGRAAELLAGLPQEVIGDILLVITELVDNVVQHTAGGGELRVCCADGTVHVEVHDRSRAFPQLQRPDLLRPGGRGLLLIAALAKTWGSRPTTTGKVVWACLETPAAPLGAASTPRFAVA
jgi:anti-sigma regulatory factor (Ser/Thr protein kinase)